MKKAYDYTQPPPTRTPSPSINVEKRGESFTFAQGKDLYKISFNNPMYPNMVSITRGMGASVKNESETVMIHQDALEYIVTRIR